MTIAEIVQSIILHSIDPLQNFLSIKEEEEWSWSWVNVQKTAKHVGFGRWGFFKQQ